MRIMIDTNVLFSALLFPSQKMDSIFDEIANNHTLIICSYVINELHDVTKRKFPTKLAVVAKLLSKMSYELVYTPQIIEEKLFEIRDINDYPILHTAIVEDVDVFITGDNDFSVVDIEKPLILTPKQFRDMFLLDK